MNMKINIGIVGYGNLGKSVEKLLLKSDKFNLVTIFSRRNVSSKYGTKIEPYLNFVNYKNKIDVMMLCGGSISDLKNQTTDVLKYFDCINSFDTHSKIKDEFTRLNTLALKEKHILIMSCGWDPGIFSIIRAMCYALSNNKPVTFWGRGISLGHSDAIRRVKGVFDAVQFTCPNKDAIKKLSNGESLKNVPLHYRECYVATDKDKVLQNEIENKIKNIPNYFLGQPTIVKFVSKEKILNLKNNLSHKGKIVSNFNIIENEKNKIEFSVSMHSNPDFTANIMINYINAIINLKAKKNNGAFTPLDIPISYLFDKNSYQKILNLIC